MSTSVEQHEATLTMFDQQVAAAKKWFASPRFAGIITLGRIKAPIPSRMSTTPPRVNNVGFTIRIPPAGRFAVPHA